MAKTSKAAPVVASRPVVKVGKHTITLGLPPSYATRCDVLGAVAKNELRCSAACLGICWEAGPTMRAPASYSSCGYDALLYGGKVVDALLEQGVGLGEIRAAGKVAFDLLLDSIPSGEAVQAAEDFSEAPDRTSTE